MSYDKGKALIFGYRSMRALNNVFDVCIVIVLVTILFFALYSIWDNQSVESLASPTQWQEYKPEADDYGSFEELQALNPEARAWLEVYGTNIDYPVMYNSENDRYISLDPLGNHSLVGSIFFDPGSSPDFSDLETIIYGHHMHKRLMFGSLDDFTDGDYFTSHQYGKLTYDGVEHGLEMWVVFQADAYDGHIYRTGIADPVDEAEYLELITSDPLQLRDSCEVLPTDHIVLMSTCSEHVTNGRTILVAKILDWVPEDPFAGEPSDGVGLDGLSEPVILYILFGIFASGVLLVIFLSIYRRRVRKEEVVSLFATVDEGPNPLFQDCA